MFGEKIKLGLSFFTLQKVVAKVLNVRIVQKCRCISYSQLM